MRLVFGGTLCCFLGCIIIILTNQLDGETTLKFLEV